MATPTGPRAWAGGGLATALTASLLLSGCGDSDLLQEAYQVQADALG